MSVSGDLVSRHLATSYERDDFFCSKLDALVSSVQYLEPFGFSYNIFIQSWLVSGLLARVNVQYPTCGAELGPLPQGLAGYPNIINIFENHQNFYLIFLQQFYKLLFHLSIEKCTAPPL